MVFGSTPRESASASTIALNVEPGWRWPFGGEVVLRLLVALGLGHRLDVAVVRVDRDDRRGRVFGLVEHFRDRFARRALHVQVDRRVDLQPALGDRLRAVAVDQLLAHVFEEEVLLALRVEVAALDLQRRVLGGARPAPAVM